MGEVRCYSRRMLNPYHGTVNVIEVAGADAVSRDGLHWSLFLQGDREFARLDDGRLAPVETPDVKFGTWSRAQGLRRGPVRMVTDYERLDGLGLALLDAVKEHAPHVPFPLRDRFELWLLAADTLQPLALIDSACTLDEMEPPTNLSWRLGDAAGQALRGGERIAALINRSGGPRPAAQWFRRDGGGVGTGLAGLALPAGLEGRLLPAQAFPELLLRASWNDPVEAALVAALLEWQAPMLLELQHLGPETRARLERSASRRALEVAARHRLYPAVMDAGCITAARVEARLREAIGRSEAACPVEEPLAPFVNE